MRPKTAAAKRRRWLFPTVTVLAVSTLVAVAALVRHPWRQVRVLPGGLTLGLDGATFTHRSHHRRVVGQWWQKALRPLLPPKLQPRDLRVGAPSGPNRTGLIFWFSAELTRQPSGRRMNSRRRQVWNAYMSPPRAEAVDETGDAVGPLNSANLQGVPGQPGVLVLPLEAFPRRGREVWLRFYQQDSPLPVAEFRAPNPAPGPHPVWQPETLPIRKQAGDLTCTLVSLVTGLRSPQGNEPAPPGQLFRTRATFQLRREGHFVHDWEPMGVTLSDATGNVLTDANGIHTRHDQGHVLSIAGGLSSREAAWKLRVELSRTALARFTPAESWTVRGIAVPGAHHATPSGKVVTRRGVRVRFLELAGADRAWYKPRVRLKVAGRMTDLRLTVRARDQKGRLYAGYGITTHGRQQLRDTQYDYYLNLAPDARVVDLTFALHRSRYVEFLAPAVLPGIDTAKPMGARPTSSQGVGRQRGHPTGPGSSDTEAGVSPGARTTRRCSGHTGCDVGAIASTSRSCSSRHSFPTGRLRGRS